MLKAENTLFYYISLYCDEWILLYNPNTVTVKSINDLYTYRTRKASKEGEMSCELLLTWLKKSKLSYKKTSKASVLCNPIVAFIMLHTRQTGPREQIIFCHGSVVTKGPFVFLIKRGIYCVQYNMISRKSKRGHHTVFSVCNSTESHS